LRSKKIEKVSEIRIASYHKALLKVGEDSVMGIPKEITSEDIRNTYLNRVCLTTDVISNLKRAIMSGHTITLHTDRDLLHIQAFKIVKSDEEIVYEIVRNLQKLHGVAQLGKIQEATLNTGVTPFEVVSILSELKQEGSVIEPENKEYKTGSVW